MFGLWCVLVLFVLFMLLYLSLAPPWKIHFALHFVIVLKDIADDFAVGDIELPFFQPERLDKRFAAVLILPLVLFDLPKGLLDMRQPFGNPPLPQSSAEYIDAGSGCHLKPYPRHFIPIHKTTTTIATINEGNHLALLVSVKAK